MPEFHKNQVRWEAPEAQKVTLAKPDYTPLANAFMNLSDAADKISKTTAAYLDNQLDKTLNELSANTDDIIKNADSLDANYDFIADEAMAKWDQTLNSFDEATRNRYLRDNPEARDIFELGVRAKTLKKSQDQIYNRSKLDIAQWSSEIVNAPADLQGHILEEKRTQIQNLGLPIEQTDNLLFSLQSEVDDYSIANAIATRDFAKADKLLKDGLPTKGASARAQYRLQLKAEMERASREKAEEERLLSEAKKDGKDADSVAILRAHHELIAQGKFTEAQQLRNDYYYGSDIPVIDPKTGAIIEVVHTAGTPSELREKMYSTMENAAKQAPDYNEYQAQYIADYNRLASGLMKTDGSLDLDDDENVTPSQYALAYKLRNQSGWDTLEKNQRVFVDNVLRTFGSDDGLYMIDLNPTTQLKAISGRGLDYQKANPVVNYQALSQMYDSPAAIIAAAVTGEHQLTGREVDTLSYFVDPYQKKFTGPYKIKRGTRADAVTAMFAQVATKNNPTGMAELGLGFVPRENLESQMVIYLDQMKQGGEYDSPMDYQTLIQDWKNIYKMTVGVDYVQPKDNNALQKYATLTIQGRTKEKIAPANREAFIDMLPRDSNWLRKIYKQGGVDLAVKEYGESLYQTGRRYNIEMDKQRAKQLDKDVVTTYEAEDRLRKRKQELRDVEKKQLRQQLEQDLGGNPFNE